MPAESEKQRRFMGSELGRLREGKKTRTGMSEEQLEDFAEKPIEKGGPGSGRPKGSQRGSKLAGYTPSGHPQYKMGGGEHINKPRRTGRFKTTYGYAGGGVQKDFFDHMEKTYGFKIEKGGPGSGRKSGSGSSRKSGDFATLGDFKRYRLRRERERSEAAMSNRPYDSSSHFAGESHGHSTPAGYPPKK